MIQLEDRFWRREPYTRVFSLSMNSILLQDLRFGFRLIRRTPLITALAVFCLASGIGLTTFMFSITYAVVGRGLPYEDQDRIIHVSRRSTVQLGDPNSLIHLDEYQEIARQQTSFSHLAAISTDGVTVGRPGQPHHMNGVYVTPSFFEVLPVSPLLGRVFQPRDAEPAKSRVLILSYRMWREHFASDPDIIGSEVVCEGEPFTVVGVMPPGYDLPFLQEVWIPLLPGTLRDLTGWIDFVTLVGTLGEGRSLRDAQSEFQVIMGRIDERQGIRQQERNRPYLRPLSELYVDGQVRLLLWSMFGATFLVLLIACSNISSLLTARMVVRTNELAIRSALGASRRRIMIQILTEALLYGIIGTVIGLFVADRALHYVWLFVQSRPFAPPEFMEWTLDPVSILVAVGLMILSVLGSAILPALRASRPNIGSLLSDNQRTGSSLRLGRLSTVSTILQLSLSFALLVAAGRLIAAIVMLSFIDYPFDERGLLIGNTGIDNESYPNVEDEVRFWEEVHRKLKTLPAVKSVALGYDMPGVNSMQDPIRIPGQMYVNKEEYPLVRVDVVTPGYFDTLGVKLVNGRDFDDGDIRGKENVAIVNTVMADKFWPRQNPIGKTFFMEGKGDYANEAEKLHRIIGVAPDLKMDGLTLNNDDGAGFYRPQGQALWGDLQIIIRTDMDPHSLIPEVGKAVASIDPDVAFTNAQTFREHVSDSFFYFRFFLTLFSTFGVLALLLASAGVYGIIQYSVSQRVIEVGIRMALGATPARIRWMVLLQGLRNTVIGLVIGWFISMALIQVLSLAFVGLPDENYSFLGALLVLLVVSLFANGFPARRASRMDPMEALRVQ